MDQTLLTALITQLTFERYSEVVYQSLANMLEDANLSGAAAYFNKRANEEREHARMFKQYILDRDELPIMEALDAPLFYPPEYNPPMSTGLIAYCLSEALNHEQTVTVKLHTLHAIADLQTQIFLQWFLTEQIEEERTLIEFIDRYELASGCAAGIILIDHELGEAAK